MKDVPGDYQAQSALFQTMGPRIEALIREILSARDVTVLSVTNRVKGADSAAKKLAAKPEKYSSYSDMHDMLGLRVITYLASDVDRVVHALRQNFEVDESRSLDKQSTLDADRFGYLSYHLVVRLSAERSGLTEWAAYRGSYFEIQIRSILQHAWAEIEHDLGYKTVAGIPAHIRRRFARLAGLLELADSEFDGVSAEVLAHVQRIGEVAREGDLASLAIDRDSIRALASAEGPIAWADRAIAERVGAEIEPRMSRWYADRRADGLVSSGLTTIREVEEAVAAESDQLIKFAVDWINDPVPDEIDPDELSPGQDADGHYESLPPGISLFYLYLHRTMEGYGGEQALSYLRNFDHPEVRAEFRLVHDRAFGKSR